VYKYHIFLIHSSVVGHLGCFHNWSVRDESTWIVTYLYMKEMLGISLAKILCLPYYAYVFSSTKLEIRAEHVLPGSKGGGRKRVGAEGRGEK
jgi:hypothetical protein